MAEGTVFEVDTKEVEKKLNDILIKNIDAKKDLKKLIRESLKEAKKIVTSAAKGTISSDPRAAYRAVRTSVYKRMFGGQVNILARRRAGSPGDYMQPRHPSAVGGNRRSISAKTSRYAGYKGADRGFVLRFINSGTISRKISFKEHAIVQNPGRNGGHSQYKNQNTGNRGTISARDWFRPAGERGIQAASEQLKILIDRAIDEVWNDGEQS